MDVLALLFADDEDGTNGTDTNEADPYDDDDDSECMAFDVDRFIVIICLGPLILITLLLSLAKKRKIIARNFLWGRPGILYPINFVDEFHRRWMYVAVFILLTYHITFIFFEKLYFQFTLIKHLGFLKMLVTMLNVIAVCALFHPLLACITLRKKLAANILGFILLIPWIASDVLKFYFCPPQGKTKFWSTVDLLDEIPLFIAIAVLLFGFSYDILLNMKRVCGSAADMECVKKMEGLLDTEEELCLHYVRHLLKKDPPPGKLSFLARIKRKFTYTSIEGFRYPPRVVCTVVVGLYALYETAIRFCSTTWHNMNQLTKFFMNLKPFFEAENSTDTHHLILVYLNTAKWSAVTCFIVAFFVQVFLMIHFISQYRQHIKKYFAGIRTWHFKLKAAPANILVFGMKYSGFQVAFLIYGYFIMTAVSFIIVMLIAGFLVIPLATKTENAISRFLIDKIIDFWPAFALGLFLYFGQVLAAKFVFLQERGAYVALDNRRLYHVISYLLFFFNIILGLFSCLKRLLFSVVFGTMMISRLDRCLLMRGFENYDSGFKAYIGMLIVDVSHNHPLVKGFVQILKEQVKKSKQAERDKSVELQHVVSESQKAIEMTPLMDAEQAKRTMDKIPGESDAGAFGRKRWKAPIRKRTRNMLWKTVTLLNNPSLILERLHSDIKEQQKKAENVDYKGAVVDSAMGLGAMFLTAGALAVGDEDAAGTADK